MLNNFYFLQLFLKRPSIYARNVVIKLFPGDTRDDHEVTFVSSRRRGQPLLKPAGLN